MSPDLVLKALSAVRDPELDGPITDLGFVAAVSVAEEIRVELRLPTYFCAPGFAWLMVADARDALAALPFPGRVTVVLLDHFAAAEINAGVAAGGSFGTRFPADGPLTELRMTFERKAHLAAQERLARRLVSSCPDLTSVTMESALRLAPAAAAAVVRRRERLGIVSAYALCDSSGSRLMPEELPGWLRFARTVRVSIDGNAEFCEGLLRTRYHLPA